MNKAGFTLIETVIYTAIIGGIMVSFVSFGLSISSIKNKSFVMQETQSNARVLLNQISAIIKSADKVITPAKGTDGDILILDMPNTNDNVKIESIDGIVYFQNGTASPQAMVSNIVNIKEINFSNISKDDSNDSVRIDFTSSYRFDSSIDYRFSYELASTANIRR